MHKLATAVASVLAFQHHRASSTPALIPAAGAAGIQTMLGLERHRMPVGSELRLRAESGRVGLTIQQSHAVKPGNRAISTMRRLMLKLKADACQSLRHLSGATAWGGHNEERPGLIEPRWPGDNGSQGSSLPQI